MTDEQADKIIKLLESILPKVDKLDAVLPIIETLGEVVMFRKMEADEVFGLNKQTLSRGNRAETFDEIGARKVYVSLRGVSVYRSKRHKKSAK